MSEETYNGWTNRETWAVALHINNDQGWQESVHEALRNADGEALPCGECGYGPDEHDHRDDHDYRASAVSAGDIIRENVEETLQPEDSDDFYGAKMSDGIWGAVQDIGSLWRVNWTELGAAFLSDIEESD